MVENFAATLASRGDGAALARAGAVLAEARSLSPAGDRAIQARLDSRLALVHLLVGAAGDCAALCTSAIGGARAGAAAGADDQGTADGELTEAFAHVVAGLLALRAWYRAVGTGSDDGDHFAETAGDHLAAGAAAAGRRGVPIAGVVACLCAAVRGNNRDDSVGRCAEAVDAHLAAHAARRLDDPTATWMLMLTVECAAAAVEVAVADKPHGDLVPSAVTALVAALGAQGLTSARAAVLAELAAAATADVGRQRRLMRRAAKRAESAGYTFEAGLARVRAGPPPAARNQVRPIATAAVAVGVGGGGLPNACPWPQGDERRKP